jgi:hypothetical protein
VTNAVHQRPFGVGGGFLVLDVGPLDMSGHGSGLRSQSRVTFIFLFLACRVQARKLDNESEQDSDVGRNAQESGF